VTEVDDLAFAIGAGLASGLAPNSIAQHLVEAGWQRPKSSRIRPLGAVAFIALVVGGVASLLLWDWRWVVIGVGLLLVTSAVGAAKDGRRG
jgi:protein-S-isoprenylcysteine O-methyltransferase Ste14